MADEKEIDPDPEGDVAFAGPDKDMQSRYSDGFDPIMCQCRGSINPTYPDRVTNGILSTVFNLYLLSSQNPCKECGSVLAGECHACNQFVCLGCAEKAALKRRELRGTPRLEHGKCAKESLAELRLAEHAARNTGKA
jgi:hypothetical protein